MFHAHLTIDRLYIFPLKTFYTKEIQNWNTEIEDSKLERYLHFSEENRVADKHTTHLSTWLSTSGMWVPFERIFAFFGNTNIKNLLPFRSVLFNTSTLLQQRTNKKKTKYKKWSRNKITRILWMTSMRWMLYMNPLP